MANPEHFAILRQGVEMWNRWREEHPEIQPDLREANLLRAPLYGVDFTAAHLRGADLHRADLRETIFRVAHLEAARLEQADLRNADLHKANLRNADLREANLHGAKLSEAFLDGASLIDTNLQQADLRGANLRLTNLLLANLHGATLSQAILHETIFSNTDLTAVTGLESCIHPGPSNLDLRTLAKSGRLPLPFLRGCGLPESVIDYLPSLFNEPFQFFSCEPFAKGLRSCVAGCG